MKQINCSGVHFISSQFWNSGVQLQNVAVLSMLYSQLWRFVSCYEQHKVVVVLYLHCTVWLYYTRGGGSQEVYCCVGREGGVRCRVGNGVLERKRSRCVQLTSQDLAYSQWFPAKLKGRCSVSHTLSVYTVCVCACMREKVMRVRCRWWNPPCIYCFNV